ncbi:MAG: pre-peptidase C-terminal domain-containing protein [Kaiparowitsia implicata GSE-PSE-MK54-09C]|jgi:tetratricopeptide (TPR) repeat protein|nr:pre-peptidase C-terminal domain-containing protein [Kaiparowitsia implicata GSE-PSE-MK54-09C]
MVNRLMVWRQLGLGLGAAIALGSVSLSSLVMMATAPAVRAQVLFEESGTLSPTQNEYSFEGTAGQAVAIAMDSEEFDTLLVLVGPDGSEVAMNDDYARSLNSTIVMTLPTAGTYTVLARSFSGQGGAYSLMVRPALAYDLAYARGLELSRNGETEQAITAFDEAIAADSTQPVAYLDRGDVYSSMGSIEEVIADYQRAADLYEQMGDRAMADTLREQIQYMQDTAY